MEFQLKINEKSLILLQKLPEKFKKGFYEGLWKAIKLVENKAKRNAPVKTGHLRRSIRSDVDKRSDLIKTVAWVGSEVEYAAVQELGYQARNISAQPYLRPAIEDNLTRIEDIIKNEIFKVTNK